MSAKYGSIENFDEEVDSWTLYIERVRCYFNANSITNPEKQKSILLASVGGKTYKLIRSLLQPDLPTDKTFDEIVDAVQEYKVPKPSVILQRFKFNNRRQKPEENLRRYMYVPELRAMAEHCDYGETLTEMLRDRLVCGLKDERIQQKLLSQKDLTWASALDVALAMEEATENASELHSER